MHGFICVAWGMMAFLFSKAWGSLLHLVSRAAQIKKCSWAFSCHFDTWNDWHGLAQFISSSNPLLQHPRDSTVQLSQWAVCANPGLQGSETWVYDPEFMCLGNFSPECCAVYVTRTWEKVRVSMTLAMKWLSPGLCVGRTAGTSGWATESGHWNCACCFFHFVIWSLKNMQGLFTNFHSCQDEEGEHLWVFWVYKFWFVSLFIC